MSKKIRLNNQASMRASFVPESYNEKSNSMDVVWTTGSRVKRSTWDGEFIEELGTKPDNVRLERFNNGAALLDNHGTGLFGGVAGLKDVLGSVENAKMVGGEGRATVRFSGRPEVKGIIDDIKSGVIRNLSVGYKVHKFEQQKEKVNDLPVLRAVDWEPMELSFVAIPADPGAQSRNENLKFEEVQILQTRNEGGEEMTEEEKQKAKEAADLETKRLADLATEEKRKADEIAAKELETKKLADVAAEEKRKEEILSQERTRVSEIRNAVKIAQLDESFATDILKDEKLSLEGARALIFKEFEKRTQTKTVNHRIEGNGMDQITARREAAVRGLLHTFDQKKFKLEEGDNTFRQGSLLLVARQFLQLEGVRDAFNMSNQEVASRALMSTSDFPNVLANVTNKSLRQAYENAPSTYAPFVQQKQVKDFKPVKSVQLSNGGTLKPVLEHGEYVRTSLSDTAQGYQLSKYGLVIGRTWELMVNDDLGAFTEIAAKLGARAKQKENEIFWGLITGNQVMDSDSIACFNSAHGNLSASSDAISIASLGAARKAMRLQTDLEGELLNLNPIYLIVPAGKETQAQQFIAQISPVQGDQVNVFSNKLQVIVEPRLDANSSVAWYMAADLSQMPIAEMATLQGMSGPEISVREGFDVDGMETKVKHVFAMSIVDYRGLFKNPGA